MKTPSGGKTHAAVKFPFSPFAVLLVFQSGWGWGQRILVCFSVKYFFLTRMRCFQRKCVLGKKGQEGRERMGWVGGRWRGAESGCSWHSELLKPGTSISQSKGNTTLCSDSLEPKAILLYSLHPPQPPFVSSCIKFEFQTNQN